MLTAVKNQIKVILLSIKYSVMRYMINRVSFISNIIFMILNNASMIVQWVIVYSIKESIGSYTLKTTLLLWGLASLTYGIAHFFFKSAFSLSDFINSGKLDTILIQPKNILLSSITTDVEVSAIGDMIYGYILLFIHGTTPLSFVTYTLLGITGGLIITCMAIITGSLAFWFGKSDTIANTTESIITLTSTYPEDIFNGFIKLVLYTIVPVGLVAYIPVNILLNISLVPILIILGFTLMFIAIANIVFYSGLKRYTSTNLMNARI
ncbi:MAG: ABC-2 family transporter protein [Bacilli bacterium]|nr:ABC-2 family transporter protein [Bacilli bacterium]